MSRYLLQPSPSANRVYATTAPTLAVAELLVCASWAQEVALTEVAGHQWIEFRADPLGPAELATIAGQSSFLALYERADGGLLRPVLAPAVDLLDVDLVTIPKYQGKTNEQFTRLLVNVTLTQVTTDPTRRWTVLDPMCGRGTTLTTSWLLGHDAAGVEADPKAVEAMGAFLRTWLRRKRLKHSCQASPVRREGKNLGKRFDAQVQTADGELSLGVFTGDTTQSAALWGKRSFDAIVTDAPYGVVHRSRSGKGKQRSPKDLLVQAVPVWASQLRPGGALGLAWNTYGMTREELTSLLVKAGLRPASGPAWEQFGHRVDSAIHRDVIVATRRH